MGRETQTEEERRRMLQNKLDRMVGQAERDVWAEMRIQRELDACGPE